MFLLLHVAQLFIRTIDWFFTNSGKFRKI